MQTVALDQALPDFHPTFLKMDIEGAEPAALRGAREMITRDRPDLAICVYHAVNHIWDIPLLLDSWGLGYRFFLRSYNAYTPEIDLGKLSGSSKQGCDVHAAVCSMPFYMLVLYPNGDVLPCCSTEAPAVFGSAARQSLGEIWTGRSRTEFLLRQLDGAGTVPVCDRCSVPAFGLQEGDSLEGYQARLRRAYEAAMAGK